MFLKKSILFLLLFISHFNVHSQNWVWAKSISGSGTDEGWNITKDTSGNIYVSGTFQSPAISFGNIILLNSGNKDIFLVKYDPLGNVLWATSFGGTAEEVCFDIQSDAFGNIYLTGLFWSPVLNLGSFTLINTSTSSEFFLVKCDSAGNVLWAQSAGGNNVDSGTSICMDNQGNIYVVGVFVSPSITFGSYILNNSVPAPNNIGNVFFVKFDSSGNVLWAQSYEGFWGYDLASFNNYIYLTGVLLNGSVALGSYTLTNSGAGGDIFIAQYNAMGNVIWAQSTPGSGGLERGTCVTTDLSGAIYLTGYFNSPSISFGGNVLTATGPNTDIFLVKYNSNGNVIWATKAGGTMHDYGYSVSTDNFGSVYLSGGFESPSITFGSINLPSQWWGTDPGFIAKYDSSGNIICASALQSGGGKNSYSWSKDNGNAIVADNYCNVYLAGDFKNSPFIVGSDTLLLSGNENVFVAKYTCSIYAQEIHTNVSCNGQCNGYATAIPVGNGVTPYSYYWSNGQTAQTATGLCAGNYTVTINDSFNCAASITVTITEPTALTFTTSVINNFCVTSSGSAAVNVSGGIPGYNYMWSNGQTTSAISNLIGGSYSVIIADSNGCTDTASVFINSFLPPVPSIFGNDTICEGDTSLLTASGGILYSWNTGATSQTISATPLTTTTYSVNVTDNNGCMADTFITVTVVQNPIASVGNNITIDFGSTATLTGMGGGSYLWSTGSTYDSTIVAPSQTTTYTLVVTDANGCTDIAMVTIFVKELKCPLYLPNAFSPNRDNENEVLQLYYNPFCVKDVSISIYDRWGELVFESDDKDFKWDGTYKGKELHTQVFVYELKVNYWEYGEKTTTMKGNVSLVR